MPTQPLRHGGRLRQHAAVQQGGQRRRHTDFAFLSRQVQDPQVFLGRPGRPLLPQGVVGHAEAAGGEQVRLVAVVGKRPRLADQPVDHVPVVDAMLAPTPQPRHLLDRLLGVPHLDPLGVQAGFHPLADQTTGHRVDVALHADRAARLHPHPQPLARLQAGRRQGPQQGQLLGQAGLTAAVGLLEQLPQESRVVLAAGEVPAAPQHQGLIQRPLELVVALLDVAVLVALAGLNGLALQAVVAQQGLVASLEGLGPCRPRLDGRRQPVGAVHRRHPAQLPEGVLQALAEALQALRKTDRSRLPIGVGEHEVVDQVGERAAVDRHAQVRAVGEITGSQPAGVMHLGEEDLLGRALQGPPSLDPPLQGAELAVAETAGEPPLQVGQQSVGLQAGVQAEQVLELGPDIGEGVGPGEPIACHAWDLAGQLAEAAVLAGGLGVHAGLSGGPLLGGTADVEAAEAAYLLVGEHREPPCRGLPLVYACSRIGNSSCRCGAERSEWIGNSSCRRREV
jgi:hypothetical protein